jgi:hypothetical protein
MTSDPDGDCAVTDKPITPEAVERSKSRQHFTRIVTVSVRWEPYKPDGQRQMGVPGRWQEMVGSGDYWRWQNCDRPDAIYPADFDWQAAVETARLEGARMALEAAAIAGKNEALMKIEGAVRCYGEMSEYEIISAADDVGDVIRALDPAAIAKGGGE